MQCSKWVGIFIYSISKLQPLDFFFCSMTFLYCFFVEPSLVINFILLLLLDVSRWIRKIFNRSSGDGMKLNRICSVLSSDQNVMLIKLKMSTIFPSSFFCLCVWVCVCFATLSLMLHHMDTIFFDKVYGNCAFFLFWTIFFFFIESFCLIIFSLH